MFSYPPGCGENDAQGRGEKYVLRKMRINLVPLNKVKVGKPVHCANHCCNRAFGGES